MSSWCVLTVRARKGMDYTYSQYDDSDPWAAMNDIVETMKNDDRIKSVMVNSPYVYAYIAGGLGMPFPWSTTEEIMQEYQFMIDGAVVLCANDTSDTGTARYYEYPYDQYDHEYEEQQDRDGYQVGQRALSVINGITGMMAADPWHNNPRAPDMYDGGTNRL